MKVKSPKNELETRASEALRTLLTQVSAIKLRTIRYESKGSMFADIDVLGHSLTLVCEVQSCAQPESLRSALRQLHDAHREDAMIPVLIAPYLSPEAQALCKESHACFVDLEGNARLSMGEVFIGKRAFTPHISVASAAAPHARSEHARVQAHPAA